MSRFLFAVLPLAGHTNPTVAVGGELIARGHDVAWTGVDATAGSIVHPEARVFQAVVPDESVRAKSHGLRGAAALRFLWEDFLIPHARSMVTGVEAAVDEFAPDVIVADQHALAGAVVARRRGLPWVTSAVLPGELTAPVADVPRLGEWIEGCIHALQRDYDLADEPDLRFSDQLVLAFTTDALLGPVDGYPEHYAFVGPAIGGRPNGDDFPWDWLDPRRRHVLVSLGTVNRDAGERFFATTLDALTDLGDRLQAVLVAPPELVGPPPEHMLVRAFVPQLELLPQMDAVVSHGGANTVGETLSFGVPLVVAPIRDDQPILAQQVADAGAGIRVRFGRVRASELRAAVTALLDEPSYVEAARRVQASFAAAGGAHAAADHLEALT